MTERFSKTYCNPVVLPDYPKMPVISSFERKEAYPGRNSKKFLKEIDIIREAGGLPNGVEADDAVLGSIVHIDGYGRYVENDARSTADPTACWFDGRWYLYASGSMIYDSDDLVHWQPHNVESWMAMPPDAPTVEKFRGKYYATGNNQPLYVSDTPLGPWKVFGEWTLTDGREFVCQDPMIFADGDRLYLYWGLGAAVVGVELDPDRPNQFITAPKILLYFHPENRWERYGGSNEDWEKAYIEGSWMKKVGDTYYLLYSCSGTEFDTYAMGAYVSDSPLGDFRLQANNPISSSRTGLIRGGGHGSVVEGPNQTLWIFYTIPLSVDAPFERRIGMDPVGIDENGEMYALTGYAFPQYIPGTVEHPELGNGAGLVPVTVVRPTRVSSYAPGHYPLYAIDEAMHTWWQPAADDTAPVFEVSLQGNYDISAARLMWKDIGLNYAAGIDVGPYKYVIEYSGTQTEDDWKLLVDASENDTDLVVDYRTFDTVRAQRVRLRILGAPKGLTPGLLNFTVFGRSASYYKTV